MLRYDRQTKPGLVALYDIRPGNGAGLFLQPRSPHGALASLAPFTNIQTYLLTYEDDRVNKPVPHPGVSGPCNTSVDKGRPELRCHADSFHQRGMTQFGHLERVDDHSTTTAHV